MKENKSVKIPIFKTIRCCTKEELLKLSDNPNIMVLKENDDGTYFIGIPKPNNQQ